MVKIYPATKLFSMTTISAFMPFMQAITHGIGEHGELHHATAFGAFMFVLVDVALKSITGMVRVDCTPALAVVAGFHPFATSMDSEPDELAIIVIRDKETDFTGVAEHISHVLGGCLETGVDM